MARPNFAEVEGFSRFLRDRESTGLLLPTRVAKAIDDEAKASAKAMTAQAAAEETDRKPKAGGSPLPKISTDADAVAFAKKLLKGVTPPVLLSAELSQDMLAAALLIVAKEDPAQDMDAVLNYCTDPVWDSPRQMFNSLLHVPYIERKCPKTVAAILDAPTEGMGELAQAVKTHWTAAIAQSLANPKKTVGKKKPAEPAEAEPARAVQIFSINAMEKAALLVRELPTEKRAAAVRILEQARAGDGIRDLPDVLKASKNLEAKKLSFENLRQPIERLQTDLIFSQAMPAYEFRIAPILLLGEPGIGKTYLASQLAQALGVPSEKISAGGAQGAFQLAGSHATWTSAKPGLVVELLAQSASASPVLIIDEVDKIHEDRHAFLPMLLDLLDAGTARQFRDEFFEIAFDASRIVFVLTANNIDKVPPPLLSRVEVFRVPAPEPEQRLRIIQKIMADLAEKTGHAIGFAPGVAEQLADRMSLDLRQLTRLATVSFAAALQAGDKIVKAPSAIDPRIGFSLRSWTPDPEQRC